MTKIAISIAIDGNEANVTNRVGSNMYAFKLLEAIEKITQHDSAWQCTVFLTAKPLNDMPKERIGWQYQQISPSKFATQLALPLALFKQKSAFDLFFTPGHYAPRFCPLPYISSVMDLAYLHYPEQFQKKDLIQLRRWTRYSVKRAKQVIAISQFTKKEVHKHYKIPEKKISVVYPALGIENEHLKISPSSVKQSLKELKIHAPYILYVGTIQPRKNLVRTIQAFEEVCSGWQTRSKGKKGESHLPQLVIAGKVGWLSGEVQRAYERSEFKNQMIMTGYVTDAQKAALYKGAQASVLLGLYEGFGMPSLESLAYGTVPIVSNSSSLPEVVGKEGITVNPENVSAIAKEMKKVLLTNRKVVHSKQVKKFTWEKSGAELLKLFAQLA